MTDQPLSALPEGLGMALAQNIYAMYHFASLPEDARRDVIEKARTVGSQEEMNDLVSGLIPH